MKIPLKKKNSRTDLWNFTAALLNDSEQVERQPAFEPAHNGTQSESAIQSSIIDYLLMQQSLNKLFVQRINNTPIYDPTTKTFRSMPKGARKGFPDIYVLIDGRSIFFEVKTGKGRQSKHQVQMQHMLEKHGAEYYVVRSVDYVKKALFV